MGAMIGEYYLHNIQLIHCINHNSMCCIPTFFFFALKLRLNNTFAFLVKLNLLPRNQALLQRTPNPHSSHGSLQAHRRWRVVQAACGELVGFGDECLPEAAVIVRRNFTTDTARLIDVDEVRGWLGVDGELTSSTGDFGGYSSVSMCVLLS